MFELGWYVYLGDVQVRTRGSGGQGHPQLNSFKASSELCESLALRKGTNNV